MLGTKSKPTTLFCGENGGALLPGPATARVVSFLQNFSGTGENSIILSALKGHTSFLDLAKKCFLVRAVQNTRTRDNNINMNSLFMAGNAAGIGYITSDAVSTHYQATRNLLEMERATQTWNHQYNDSGPGTVDGCPKVLSFSIGNTLKGINFHPQKHDEGLHPLEQGEHESENQLRFFKPFSRS
jgi:hypothetical protein